MSQQFLNGKRTRLLQAGRIDSGAHLFVEGVIRFPSGPPATLSLSQARESFRAASRNVASQVSPRLWPLVRSRLARHTAPMKNFVALLVALAIAGGIYFFYFKRMPTTDAGTAPTQAISLTGVRM